MAIAFIEGFDKYGPSAPAPTTALNAQLFAWITAATRGEWTPSGASGIVSPFIGPPLSSAGGSMVAAATTGTTCGLSKTLTANYATAIGGVRFQVNSFGASTNSVMAIFKDSSTNQASIGINSSGQIIIINAAGTTVATSTASVTTGAPHYLEWSIGMSSTGAYIIYLDGVSILSGTANFHGSSNNYYNTLFLGTIGTGGAANNVSYDDLYVDDGTGAVLLTAPIVQTQFPNSDSAVTFSQGAYAVGYWNNMGAGTTAPGANTLYLRKFTAPTGGVTLNSVSILPQATSATANFKAVLYADSSGSPGALIATGTQVTGTTAGTPLVGAFSSGQALSAGTAYWIGFITDTSVVIAQADTLNSGVQKANTYTSGAPNPASTVTTGVASWMIWGNTSAATTNNAVVAEQAPLGVWGDFGYVTSTTVGNEDLYGFPALTGSPVSVYAVSVKAMMRDATSGARTVTLNTKSSGTDSPGSNSGFTPTTAYDWFGSVFITDPSTSVAWTVAGVNAAVSGYKITA